MTTTALPHDPALEALWMPFTANKAFKAKPRLLVSAKDMHYQSDDGRQILRTRAGLGSGLELLLPDDLWTNVPVVESFAASSPFSLNFHDGGYWVHRHGSAISPVTSVVLK